MGLFKMSHLCYIANTIVMAGIVVINGCQSRGGDCYLSDNEEVLIRLQDQDLFHDLSSLPFTSAKPESLKGKIVAISQPRDVASDIPRFYLLKREEAEQLWILKSGGVMGQTHWYGPLGMRRDGTLELWKPIVSRE